MTTLELFRAQRAAVTEKWVNQVFGSYPLDTHGFLRTKQDPFCNPVGEITTTVANYLYDAIAGENILQDRLHDALERFVRLRAVQDFAPSVGLGVLYVFKSLIREAVLPQCTTKEMLADYLEAESRLDTLGLIAFDMYISAHKAIAEQRITEIRNQHAQLVRWAQTVEGSPVRGPGKTNL